MILPKTGAGKIINFSMSIFLLSIMFSGLFFGDIKIEPDFDIITEFDDIDEKLSSLKETKTFGEIERKLEDKVKQDLLLNKISPLKILININTDDKSNILIKRMEIFLKEGEEYDERKIKNYINKKYNIIPEIKF